MSVRLYWDILKAWVQFSPLVPTRAPRREAGVRLVGTVRPGGQFLLSAFAHCQRLCASRLLSTFAA